MSKLPTPYQEFARKYKAVWKAYDGLGATPEEIRHAVLLAATTLGFPTTVAVLTWVEDILRPGKAARARRR